MPAISSSVKASSMPLVAKSKFSASESSDSASISSGSRSISAARSSASVLVAAGMGLQSVATFTESGSRPGIGDHPP